MGRIIQGDCVEVMAGMAEASVDAIACDPPYGLEFMGKEWDRLFVEHPEGQKGRIGGQGGMDTWGTMPQYEGGLRAQAWHHRWATEALRVLKPGAHLAAMGGTRTVHRLMVALEDAGFTIRETIAWHYLSGFPKNHDISKAIDRNNGAQPKVVGYKESCGYPDGDGVADYKNRAQSEGSQVNTSGMPPITEPATPDAQKWHGWGTALKPSWEPIVLARKPLSESSIARNVLEHGTGGVNVDATRVPWEGNVGESEGGGWGWPMLQPTIPAIPPLASRATGYGTMPHSEGRWPANTIRTEPFNDGRDKYFLTPCFDPEVAKIDDALLEANGFFFVPKASRSEREFGCEGLEEGRPLHGDDCVKGKEKGLTVSAAKSRRRNTHPTCKPLALFRTLVRLLAPPGGIVLDPFFGSGTTGCAAILEGFEWMGIEQDEHYCEIAEARTKAWAEKAREERKQLTLETA